MAGFANRKEGSPVTFTFHRNESCLLVSQPVLETDRHPDAFVIVVMKERGGFLAVWDKSVRVVFLRGGQIFLVFCCFLDSETARHALDRTRVSFLGDLGSQVGLWKLTLLGFAFLKA